LSNDSIVYILMILLNVGQAKQDEASQSGLPPDVQEQALRDMVVKATENVIFLALLCPPGVKLFIRLRPCFDLRQHIILYLIRLVLCVLCTL
jgi:hypothetical protein